MKVGRRRALALMGAGGAEAIGLPPMQLAAAPHRPQFASAVATESGEYAFALMDENGRRTFEAALSYRGHGCAFDPLGKRLAIVARRPGQSLDIFDFGTASARRRRTASAGHHFYGHAVFSPDGDRLYTTENAYESGEGMVGVWDARAGFKRLGQYSSGGIGPHEIRLLPDGTTLLIANGGIRTHPESGRQKLNLATMAPNLAAIDRRTGKRLWTIGFEDTRLRKLSIRHLAVNRAGTVCVALQDQTRYGEVPLAAFHYPGAARLKLANPPPGIARRMRGYTGSAAFDADGEIAAVSAPRGNLVTFWDAATARYRTSCVLEDCSGVAPTAQRGEFLLTRGTGGVFRFNALTDSKTAVVDHFATQRHWDNHLSAIPWS